MPSLSQEEEQSLKEEVSHLMARLRGREEEEEGERPVQREEEEGEEMRKRIMELLHTLEKVKRDAELQQQRAEQAMEEMRRANR